MKVKSYFFAVSLLFIFCINGFSQSSKGIPEGTKTILFLGNSITYAGQYVSYIDAYYTITQPAKSYTFINVGLPSETVSGLSEPNHANGEFPRPDLHDRLERILEQIKPDLVFASYGMNDGIYLPFDETRFEKFKDGLNWLHESVEESGASIIHITPPIFDSRKGEAYANVLDIYSDWLISKKYTDNWNVIDIHWPMKKYIEDKRLNDPSFAYAKDGVHPNDIGHWVMAKEILINLGENVSDEKNILEAVSEYSNAEEIINLVEERQAILKDSWLTTIGHKRPGMKRGLPIDEAQLKANEITGRIKKFKK